VENNSLMVIELKVVQATKDTYLQISDYIDSINKDIGVNREVQGIVISSGYNKEFKRLIDSRSDISQIDFEQLGL
jgi:RecB family endonuclease NucS